VCKLNLTLHNKYAYYALYSYYATEEMQKYQVLISQTNNYANTTKIKICFRKFDEELLHTVLHTYYIYTVHTAYESDL